MKGTRWILLFCCLFALGAHPVSNYPARLVFTAEGLELSIDFTYDDVYLNQQVGARSDGRFAAEDLEQALQAFERRLVDGTRIYEGNGEPLAAVNAELTSDPLSADGLDLAGLLESGGTLRLVFPRIADPEEVSILVDWGSWRQSVSTTIACEFEAPDGRQGRVHWKERQRYPLLPPEGAEQVDTGDELVYVVRPLEETLTGFSYIYVEPDHVRHELVLPLLATGWLLAEETELSATDRLGAEERSLVRRALEEGYGDPPFLWSDERPLPASETMVRWFTQDSVKQGVVTGDRPIPISTGFVGVLSVHPLEAPIDQLTFDASPWNQFVGDHVVSVISAERIERYVTSTVGSTIHWQGWAPELPSPPNMEVSAETGAGGGRGNWAWWIALVGLLGVGASAARRRRKLAGVLFVGTLVGAGLALFVPPDAGSPSPSSGREVLGALLENVYRACGRQDEHEALTLLSEASAGPLLEELYLELRGQIRGPWATGAGTRVTSVVLEECNLDRNENRSLGGRCVWSVAARIEHWGHVHERSLRVTASVGAAVSGGAWHLRDVRLLDKQVVGAASHPRR